ncbi:MAG: cell division protein CrgA [Actinomycetota bacterium]
MPESRSRKKRKGQRYQVEPQRKKRSRHSPRWYGPVVLGVIGFGVAVVIGNYLRGDSATNGALWTGLGIIGAGFVGLTFWK